ncbi:MAG TPA: hypothetical protein VHZ51_24145 [Ktedonobacteraceae bacterium]|nr:hypothetical protein [Ktedonobacteraceae bacterium]
MLLALVLAVLLSWLTPSLRVMLLARGQQARSYAYRTFLVLALAVTLAFFLNPIVLKVEQYHLLGVYLLVLLVVVGGEWCLIWLQDLLTKLLRANFLLMSLVPIPFEGAMAIGFTIGAGMPWWWAGLCVVSGSVCALPLVLMLAEYERERSHQGSNWHGVATDIWLLRRRWYSLHIWHLFALDSWLALRASYRKWQTGWGPLHAIIITALLACRLPAIVLGSFLGWWVHVLALSFL